MNYYCEALYNTSKNYSLFRYWEHFVVSICIPGHVEVDLRWTALYTLRTTEVLFVLVTFID